MDSGGWQRNKAAEGGGEAKEAKFEKRYRADGKGRLFDICKLIEPSTRGGNLINRTGGGC